MKKLLLTALISNAIFFSMPFSNALAQKDYEKMQTTETDKERKKRIKEYYKNHGKCDGKKHDDEEDENLIDEGFID